MIGRRPSAAESRVSATPAIHFLAQGRRVRRARYRYEEHGGTRVSARELGVDEHAVVKTLVMEDERQQPLIVLMHGDREVSTKQLARQTGRKTVTPCEPAVAKKHTGYLVGGTSPFGTRKALPVYAERTILDLDTALHQRRAARLPGGDDAAEICASARSHPRRGDAMRHESHALHRATPHALWKMRRRGCWRSATPARRSRRAAAWSPREIIGHLVDSASNNHQRFVRARVPGRSRVPGLRAGRSGCRPARYQDAPWDELVALWRTFNLQIARVMEATPDELTAPRAARAQLRSDRLRDASARASRRRSIT